MISAEFDKDAAPMLIVMGQSNAHGHAVRLTGEEKKAYPLQNVYGLSRKFNQFYGLSDVVWEHFTTAGMNLGEEQDDTCCLAGEFAGLWQREIRQGKKLPDLYVIQISIGCQGIDEGEVDGKNMWFKDRERRLIPGILEKVEISLYPLAIEILKLATANLKKAGKKPMVIGLHWNQWETEVESGEGVLLRAESNYRRLFAGFYQALGGLCPTYLYYPHSEVYNNETGRRQLIRVYEKLEGERRGIKIVDLSKSFLWDITRQDKGIFQEDLVHYSKEAQRWFAKYQFQELFGKKILALGDSVTADGRYLGWIEKYLRLHRPDILNQYCNGGLCSENISGLTEAGHPGPRPYLLERVDALLEEYEPDMVILCYGMNDGIYHPFREEYFSAFKRGMGLIIKKLKERGIEICLMTPPSFEADDFQGPLLGDGEGHYSYLSPWKDYDLALNRYGEWMVQEWEGRVNTFIDLHTILRLEHEQKRQENPDYVSGDGIHPGEHGHFVIAAALIQALYGVSLSAMEQMGEAAQQDTMWEGYQAKRFFFHGYEAVVVFPEKMAKGNPWVYRTEFFGEFAATDLLMLEKGYGIANLRISNMYGAPKAVLLMEAFCGLLAKRFGFAQKTILFGFSRGGLYALHFAAACPKRVKSIYFDAPVVDVYSWPGQYQEGQSREWKDCKRIWHLDIGAPFFRDSVTLALSVITSHQIPVAMVYGDADELVPYEENGQIIEEACRSFKTPFFVNRKKGCGHHPHGLAAPGDLVGFLIK